MMTDKQREELLRLKAQGFTKEQAIARVFTSPTNTQPVKQGSFTGTQDRLAEVGLSTADTIKQNIEGTGEFADQSLLRRGVQATAAGFTSVPRGAFAMLPSQVREPAERLIGKAGEGINKGIGAIADTELIKGAAGRVETDPNGVSTYKKNDLGMLEEGLGIFSGLGEIAGTAAGAGGTAGTLTTTANFALRQAIRLRPGGTLPGGTLPGGTLPPPPPLVRQTPEKIFSNVETDLQRISKDPNLTPAERAAAAEASLTYRERLAGVLPDEKKRIQEMAPGTLERYFDQAHMRNVDDMVDSPYTMGAKRADEALEELNKRLTETGGIIGNTRQKLSTYQLSVDDVKLVEDTLVRELAKLNLSIKNGQIGVTPGKIGKTASNSDISTLQALYNDMLTFKQSPTVANAIDLRMKFDGKINFDKSAREASNSVDPVSKSVRSALADGAAKVVGKTEARELQRYSDFMEAYADLKSYTDRAAGGEYLLRLVLSGRGGDAKKLINTVKSYTGIDLMDDALAMKLATDIIGNEGQKNLFRQEVTKAGLDAARLFSGDVRGFGAAVAQRLIDKGINPEDVYRAIAAGAGGYLLLTYTDEEGMMPAAFVILAAMPNKARQESIEQARKIAASAGRKFELPDEVADQVLKSLNDEQPMQKLQRLDNMDIDADDFARLEILRTKSRSDALTNEELIEAGAIMEKYGDQFPPVMSGKVKSATTETNLLDQPRNKGKFATKGTPDPKLRTNRDVPMKDVAGAKLTVPKGAVIEPKINEKGQALIKVNGSEYLVPKNQYDNLKGQSTRAIASEFAPELKGTVETIKYSEYQGKKLTREENLELNDLGRKLSADGLEGAEKARWNELMKIRNEQNAPNMSGPKYSQYTLDGGENYREILTQAPEAMKKGEWGDVIDKSQTYRSSHWSEPNVIAHLRLNERTIKTKNDTLFMEELQSDWAREARSKEGIPNNPLLKDWQIHQVKRFLMEAANSNKKYAAWINGEQTSARYDLATHVESVKWEIDDSSAVRKANGGKNVVIQPKEGKSTFNILVDGEGTITSAPGSTSDWKGKKLDEVLGKGLADKIMADKKGTLSGDGLFFGGEWAKNLYDRQVRDIVKKLTGAEVKTVDMGLGTGGKRDKLFTMDGDEIKPDTKIKVGTEVGKGGDSKYYIVTDVLGDGKYKAVDSQTYQKWVEMLKATKPDINDERIATRVRDFIAEKPSVEQTFDISTPTAVQQYIELTPEVKAKIQSKAPKFKMKNGVTVAMPLLLAYFYAEAE
jgi:hypothetical protein